MTKDQIKEAPDHDADRHATGEHGYENWNRALVEHASENNATLVRIAAAVSAAHGEQVLRGRYRQAQTH